MNVFETTISKRAQEDWEKEVEIARGDGVKRFRWGSFPARFPLKMIWDGIKNKPDRIKKGNYFCFVMSTYKLKGDTHEGLPMGVYLVDEVLGSKSGREWWMDRGSSTISLTLKGLIRRGKFCNLYEIPRKTRPPMGTQVCKLIDSEKLIANMSSLETLIHQVQVQKQKQVQVQKQKQVQVQKQKQVQVQKEQEEQEQKEQKEQEEQEQKEQKQKEEQEQKEFDEFVDKYHNRNNA